MRILYSELWSQCLKVYHAESHGLKVQYVRKISRLLRLNPVFGLKKKQKTVPEAEQSLQNHWCSETSPAGQNTNQIRKYYSAGSL